NTKTGSTTPTASLAPTTSTAKLTSLNSTTSLDSAFTDTKPSSTSVRLASAIVSTPEPNTTAATPMTPTPGAVSPIATLLALPGKIAYAVLGLIGVTPAAGTTPPISPAPIVQLVWAAFREFENFMGLDAPLVNQPVMPTETFTGSLTTATPTVAQLLDAATAEYVLGGTPGGLTPLTVNGFPMTYTNDFSGAAAKVWVTPQNQIIIAYSGTTGGTNLLFNPLIAISQAIADYQAGFTDTTPQAFTDSLTFAQQVQAAAAAQGYDPNDVFVTGHSLGGWEAEYVSQQSGLRGIGFESPGLHTTVPGNGADTLFVNVETYGDVAAYTSSDIPGMQPFAPAYVPAGGSDPHYGPIVMLGDPSSQTPLTNASALWGTSLFGDLIFAITSLGNFLQYHLPSVQAYSLDVTADPSLLPGTGTYAGPIYTGFGDLTIPQFLAAASAAGILY